jgi:biopolymer transport protein ExbB
MEGYQLDVWKLINQGALATYPLLVLSVIGLAVILERLWALRNVVRSTAELALAVGRSLASFDLAGALKTCRSAPPCPAQRIFTRLLEAGGDRSADELKRVAEDGQYEEVQRLSASLWVLGTIGSSAPFIGLLGTVVGIIKAFQSMAITGAGGFSIVAAGISEALIATALGLGVAIIALMFYNYFQSRVERIEATLRIHAARLADAVANGRRSHAA